MRTIERTTIFKRDFKREMKERHRHLLDTDLRKVIAALANDQPLELRYRDHALTGNWSNYRDCHIRPDLVLIYRLVDQDRLILVHLGSHSQLDL
ncbi:MULTISPECIES: type II toxin-antitoxin system YafQ family toxin [unclassified Bartonella]|uniref:type II toxin-antitoxin system YafQ family toxin n=1 Tax=unclassified Bartonella TaxID=2645622 RepID=UPI00235F57E3|nr:MULTISPECIES: type II toxin-antitoxin system YafQ family toxin [unclassified Bartonella]